MKTLKYILLALVLIPALSQAQCRAFTKSKCLPLLEGYVQSDNYNSAVLVPGDEAELLLTFYANKQYRLVVCAHQRLGSVDFEVLDANRQMVYSSKDNTGENSNVFDFKMATTQQLYVMIRVPELTAPAAIVPEGCVAVMIGFKD